MTNTPSTLSAESLSRTSTLPRDSVDSSGGGVAQYFKRMGTRERKEAFSVKPRWLRTSSRFSGLMSRMSVISLGSMQDLSISKTGEDYDESLGEVAEDSKEDNETEEDTAQPDSAVGKFVNERVTTFMWNVETLAGNIAGVFGGSREEEEDDELVEINFSNPGEDALNLTH